MQVINLLEVMGDAAKEEEVKEGMEHDHAHDEDHDEEDHDHEEEAEYDEHIWLSLRNAKTVCTEIADRLSILDSANKDDYKANLDAYTAELDRLDGDFKALTDGAKQKTLVFGDRFLFRYFADDCGMYPASDICRSKRSCSGIFLHRCGKSCASASDSF